MKKMNFYFNFGRCYNLLLPALLFLTGTLAFAGNPATPSKNTHTEKVSKKAMVAGNLLLGFTPQNGGPDGNGTVRSMCGMKTGSFSWRISTAATTAAPGGFNAPFTLRVEAFNSVGLSAGVVTSRQYLNSGDLSATGNNFIGTMSNLEVGIYTVRVTAESPLGEVIEQSDYLSTGGIAFNGIFSSLTILPSNDTEDPILTVASPNVTLAATGACAVPAFLAVGPIAVADAASLGITAQDCYLPTVTFSIVSISAPITVGDPTCRIVTVRANDNRNTGANQTGVVGSTNDQPDAVVCVRVTDQTRPWFVAAGTPAGPGFCNEGSVAAVVRVFTATDCNGMAPAPYPVPAIGDNCSTPVVTVTGPATGAILGVGTYPVVYTAKDAVGNTRTCSFTVRIDPFAPPVTALTCVGNLNIGLDNNCSNVMTPTSVLSLQTGCPPAGLQISIKKGGVWSVPAASVTYGSSDIGRTYEYRVSSTNPSVSSCGGTVTIVDNAAPKVVVPADVTLQCNDANATALLPNATSGTPTGSPSVGDCSAWTTNYTDAMVGPVGCGGTMVIARTWSAKDAFGNTTIAAAIQTITVRRDIWDLTNAALVPVVPAVERLIGCAWGATPNAVGMIPNVTINCSDLATTPVSAVPGPYVYLGSTAATAVKYYLATNAICGLSARIVDEQTIQLCPGSYKIVRTWEVSDLCGTLYDMALVPTMSCRYQQVITVQDNVKPTATATYTDYKSTTISNTDCKGVGFNTAKVEIVPVSNVALPDDYDHYTTLSCVTLPGRIIFPYSVAITPRGLSDMCGASVVNMTIRPTDVCGSLANNPVSVNNNALTVTANGDGTYTIKGTLMASNLSPVTVSTGCNGAGTAYNNYSYAGSFIISIADACGNVKKYTILVDILDNVSPVAVCDGVTATLNTNKQAILRASSFNNSSSDNCGIDKIYIRRDEVSTWCDTIKYECQTPATKVWIRYIDFAGNFTDCCVPVTIVDKSTIYCTSPANVDVLCNSAQLNNVASLFGTPAVTYDGCAPYTTKIDSSSTPINCGTGSFTRVWTYSATNFAGTTTARCSQTINVKPVLGFRVTPIGPRNLTCSGDVKTLAQDKQDVINSLQTLHDGSFTNTAATVFNTCSAPVVEAEEWTYSNTEYCKVIVRRFTIKDACMFSSNTDANDYGLTRGTQLQSTVVSNATPWAQIIRFTSYTYIKDLTAPVPTTLADTSICAAITACNFGFTRTLSADDGCTGGTSVNAATGSSLFYTWRLVNSAGVTVNTGLTSTVTGTNLPFGTYTVYFRVSDLCGNLSNESSFKVSGKDCKLPEILVHDKIVALGGVNNQGRTGMATLKYEDIANALRDNCTSADYLARKIVMEKTGGVGTGFTQDRTPRSTTFKDTVMFWCSDLYPSNGSRVTSRNLEVRVWTQDESLNWNYAISTITLQDNEGICAPNTFTVSGSTLTEGNAAVANVAVSASVNGAVVATTNATNSTFALAVAPATNVQVRAAKTNNDDAATGVTTFDIAKVSQHVLDIEKLATPYKLIAADVDKSGVIDALDMLHMRRFILKITPSLPGGNFRFVDKAYGFRNPSDPFGEDFPEVVNIASLSANASANFVAVKLGDVNDSYAGTTVRSSRSLTLNANDMNVVAGNEYTVNISADKMDAAAFQGTFSFNGATVKSVKAGNLANMTDGNFGIFANAVTTSWNGKTQDAADVMTITFVANKSGKLSDMLTVNSALTQSVANDATGNEMNVNLKFNTGKVAGGEFALYQNQPNPVAGETTIGFNLPKDGAARLTVTSVDGKVVKVLNGEYKAGYNTVTINKSDIQASGVFYYRLETADHSASKKMVIME